VTDSSIEFYKKAPPDGGASSFIYPPTEANLRFFAKALSHGCIVSIPTETVYGLAALALNEDACRSIFSIKGRPLMDPLIVHVENLEMAAGLAVIPDIVTKLADKFWPGPLTLILKKQPVVPDMVTAGKDTVAIRIPRHPVTRNLLKLLGAPLAAPSANPFGYVSPTRPQHVSASFGAKVPFILDGGPCEVGLESTILDLSDPGCPAVLRPGAISAEALAGFLDFPVETRQLSLKETEAATAPGTMMRHYSPRTQLIPFESGSAVDLKENDARIFLQRPDNLPVSPVSPTYWFSEDGSMEEIARTLFDLLRQLDNKGYGSIHCELPPSGKPGIARAIRDRLARAAAQK
jgi:L-threonylcarbamoyladenylate synthase